MPVEADIERTPLRWRDTRARLRPDELARENGPLTMPAPSASEDEPSSG